jgi:archaellum component FlaG (FlaF/FlaG flagellin family)
MIVDPDTALAPTASGTVQLTVRLMNTSDETVRFDSGQPTAVITDVRGMPLTLDIVGGEDMGVLIELEPGEHQDFDLDVSLAACDPALGYMISPGDHHIVISLHNGQLQTEMNSDPVPVVIGN